ncbi:GNAT family N-acetyltransferase [uncultured Exiguobacterium sp.]|uniref:GNAT family N-acetyltransferase n=1 Tax=uncultured Exiguobacterium sp. TaxID=202669 RepID=UPI0025EB88C8|nr:GNAT family N-acetyltransferase [uncultured Exiguobacterium sp.]
MDIQLQTASLADAARLHTLQIEAFSETLERYQDFATNPSSTFHQIIVDDIVVGGICVVAKAANRYAISPMFLDPARQGEGIAQRALQLVEAAYPAATTWELRTIREETRNCYFYEKMGYRLTGVSQPLNERATLVSYQKSLSE